MILFRCVGDLELKRILLGETVYGYYNCKTEELNTCHKNNVLCFFAEKAAWIDSKHKYILVLDINEKKLELGEGRYFAPSNFRKTKIWSGRDGYDEILVKEAYKTKYTPKDVKGVFCLNHLDDSELNHLIDAKDYSFYIDKYSEKANIWKSIYSFLDTNLGINKGGKR